MFLLVNLGTALSNLRANKLRSVLTMLGVIIGVGAVIIMVSLVEGLRTSVIREFERLGSQLIIIVYQPNMEDRRREAQRIVGLTMDDVRAIEAECTLIKSLSAELPTGNEVNVRYRDRETKVSPVGVQPDYTYLRNVSVARGRFLTQADQENWSKVCVVGAKIQKELFPEEDPLGKDIEVQGVSVTIVGVLEPKGRTGGQDADATLLVPITTIQKRFIGVDLVGVIWAQPKDAQNVTAAMDQVWECLMRRHQNAPGFRVDSQENILRAIGRILTVFGLVLGGIAGLALLVGGIGIMNIMLVSVTERTREIGLRKAVGARRRDILWQFLIESATVSGMGGMLGIALGAGVAYLVGFISRQFIENGPGNQPGLPIHLPLWAILGAFAFSAMVGLFFGIYPAMRAARLDPITALRHE
jgi:putative ABC transport system permease protein